ncbi:MAG: CCA tRNA nucleotidyltransferase [Planctomycetes bacterium]|nr:CCA tRNA nucleotidyltransferase [Planctomycetota bacterium]
MPQAPRPASAGPRAFAEAIVRRLAGAGYRALFAGGCVRDMELGRTPKDWDVATSARPEQVQALFPRTVAVGEAFGVVRVLDQGDDPRQVEVATFRTESGYSDGRHPDQVAFADEKADVQRRDFTVNGLLFDPLTNEVLDYVGGRADLKAKVLRAIGDPDARFREDKLRLLRAVRFAAELGFSIEPATLAAVCAHASEVTAVSAERIRDELEKMLTGPDPRGAFELLHETGLLPVVLPEVAALCGVEQPPEFHPEGDVWVHTLMLLEQLQHATVTLALGALLHDIGKPPTYTKTDRVRFNEHEKVGAEMAAQVLERLRFPGEVIERVGDLVKQHMAFKDVPRMRPAKLKRFLRQPHFDEHLALHRLDCMASHGKLDAHAYCEAKLAELGEEDLRPAPLIDGNDLKALGLVPGPLYGKILSEVEDLQLEGGLTTPEQALAHVRAQYLAGNKEQEAS